MKGKNLQLTQQIEVLHDMLRYNQPLYRIIEESEKLNLANYYIGAGCISQTVWNYQNGNPPLFGMKDIDFVYFDSDLSWESENIVVQTVQERFSDCPLDIDIKNQARVHLWYKDHFGHDITPHDSVEAAVNTWPTTSTTVCIRLVRGKLSVYAPYGLNDMFSQIIRPNKLKITRDMYEKKVYKWLQHWPSLSIIPW